MVFPVAAGWLHALKLSRTAIMTMDNHFTQVMRLEKMSVSPNLRSAGNAPLTRPSGTLSPLERAVSKKEILSPRPHRGREAGPEGAVVAAAHNLGFQWPSEFPWRGQIFIGFSGAF